ncbi:MAG: hypothetical protein KTR16_11595 [Acidiferrobacterales bacterium]|nr:hypothetical protein [Acidiferrobacterales bacterium]
MILDDLKAIIDDSGIFAGYGAHSFFGLNDANSAFKNASKWTSFKVDGGGRIDPIYGEPIVRLWVGGSSSTQLARYNDTQSIIDFMNANYASGKILNILVQSDVKGPFPLDGDRSYFEIHLRLTQSRG